jgi:co-chaperonin GroES (HSP10)
MMTIALNTVQPLGAKILARRYRKPLRVGSIIVPDTVAVDETMSLWEAVRCGPRVGDTLGFEPEPDDILRTEPWRGIYVAQIDSIDYFMLEARDVIGVVSY